MTQALLKKGQDEQFPSRILKFPSTRNANEVSRPRFGYGGENFSDEDYVEFVECCPNMEQVKYEGITLEEKAQVTKQWLGNLPKKKILKMANLLFCVIPTKGESEGKDLNNCLCRLVLRYGEWVYRDDKSSLLTTRYDFKWNAGNPKRVRDEIEALQPVIRAIIAEPVTDLSTVKRGNILEILDYLNVDDDIQLAALTKQAITKQITSSCSSENDGGLATSAMTTLFIMMIVMATIIIGMVSVCLMCAH